MKDNLVYTFKGAHAHAHTHGCTHEFWIFNSSFPKIVTLNSPVPELYLCTFKGHKIVKYLNAWQVARMHRRGYCIS